MKKKIIFNDQEYEIEIKWATENYCFRVIGIGGYQLLPKECLTDIEKFKLLITFAIKNNYDLKAIEMWDGKF